MIRNHVNAVATLFKVSKDTFSETTGNQINYHQYRKELIHLADVLRF